MTSRADLLETIAHRIADYRQGEIPPITPGHVERWVRQFDSSDQDIILTEMVGLLRAYYISKDETYGFVHRLLADPRLFDPDLRLGHQATKFLQIQRKGNSQNDLIRIVEEILVSEYGQTLAECGQSPSTYIYLDDCLFTGLTAVHDLEAVLPYLRRGSTLHVVVIAVYWRNFDYFCWRLESQARPFDITILYWRCHEFYDLADDPTRYDCLWPQEIDGDRKVQAYIQSLIQEEHIKNYPLRLFRPPTNLFHDTLFSSPTGRDIVERAFLKAGLEIVAQSKLPNPYMRPLGYEKLRSFGFGAIFMTYRNCPNNCPLALWWGAEQRWYPLFPRKINDEGFPDE